MLLNGTQWPRAELASSGPTAPTAMSTNRPEAFANVGTDGHGGARRPDVVDQVPCVQMTVHNSPWPAALTSKPVRVNVWPRHFISGRHAAAMMAPVARGQVASAPSVPGTCRSRAERTGLSPTSPGYDREEREPMASPSSEATMGGPVACRSRTPNATSAQAPTTSGAVSTADQAAVQLVTSP